MYTKNNKIITEITKVWIYMYDPIYRSLRGKMLETGIVVEYYVKYSNKEQR